MIDNRLIDFCVPLINRLSITGIRYCLALVRINCYYSLSLLKLLDAPGLLFTLKIIDFARLPLLYYIILLEFY